MGSEDQMASRSCPEASSLPLADGERLAGVASVRGHLPLIETAAVWKVNGRRFFTRRGAERAAIKAAIRDFDRDTGDPLDLETRWAIIDYLMPRVRAGEPVTAEMVDGFFNPFSPASASAPHTRINSGTNSPGTDSNQEEGL